MHLSEYFQSVLNGFGPFEAKPEIAIAVSGGADSMALCLLAQEWVGARGGKVIALTVDHGLRAESRHEAEQVEVWLAARGIEHHILTWEHETIPTSGIPAAAREVRYGLMGEWCRAHGVLNLLVAHHAFDQAETVALRMERGQKGDALAGMRMITVRDGVRILRPLLEVKPDKLREFLQEQKQEWIEDPSNQDMRFARNAMRKKLDEAQCDALCAQAKLAGEARVQNEMRLAQAMAREVEFYPEGWCEWRVDVESSPDPQLFSALVHAISSSDTSVRWEEILMALELLFKNKQPAVTLGGCYIEWAQKFSSLRFIREQAAVQKSIPLQNLMLWDGRFEIRCENPRADLRIEALGAKDYLAIKPQLSKTILERLPRKVILTLPTVKALEGGLKLPHIEYEDARCADIAIDIRWMPGRPLTGHPFFKG